MMRFLSVLLLVLVFSVPGAATYIYGSEKDVPDLLATLLSVAILVPGIVLLAACLRNGLLRYLLAIVLLFLFLCYQFAGFLANFFLGQGFGEGFMYHFNIDVFLNTWYIYWDITLAFALSAGAMLLLTIFAERRRLDNAMPWRVVLPVMLLAVLVDPEVRRMISNQVMYGEARAPLSMESIDWDGLKINQQAVTGVPGAAVPGKNLVMIFMEGLESLYADEAVFPGLTPYLNSVMQQNLRFTDMRQVSGSEWTVGGMVSSLCGTPLLYQRNLNGNNILFSRFLENANCLSDVLATAGYRQHFLGGAAMEFAGKGPFLEAHEYDRVAGREQLLQELDDPGYRTGWGLYDDSLFALAAEEFDRLAAGDQPFNLTLLTLDTHHPNGFPSASCPPYPHIDNSILHAVHCTDSLLQQFIGKLQAHPAYENTVVVLVSDHLSMRNAAYGLFPENYPRRLIFTAINAGRQQEIGSIGAPMNIAPTVLDLLEVRHDTVFLAGDSMLKEVSPELAVNEAILYSRPRQRALRYLNSRQLSSVPGDVCASRTFVSGAQRNGLRVGEAIIPLVRQGEVINKRDFPNQYIAVAAIDGDRKVTDSWLIAPEQWPAFADEVDADQLLVVGRTDLLGSSIRFPEAGDGNQPGVAVVLGEGAGDFTLLGNFATLNDIMIPGSNCEAAFAGQGI